MEPGIWTWIKRNTLDRAIRALSDRRDIYHGLARAALDKNEQARLRGEAESDAEARKDLWHITHRGGGPVQDHSVSNNSAPVQQTNVTAPIIKSARDLVIATVMAACVLTILILSYLLHDAYKDIQTQVWVKQDKEEEKFQKFVAGPDAALAGELKANEILFNQQCKGEKK